MLRKVGFHRSWSLLHRDLSVPILVKPLYRISPSGHSTLLARPPLSTSRCLPAAPRSTPRWPAPKTRIGSPFQHSRIKGKLRRRHIVVRPLRIFRGHPGFPISLIQISRPLNKFIIRLIGSIINTSRTRRARRTTSLLELITGPILPCLSVDWKTVRRIPDHLLPSATTQIRKQPLRNSMIVISPIRLHVRKILI